MPKFGFKSGLTLRSAFFRTEIALLQESDIDTPSLTLILSFSTPPPRICKNQAVELNRNPGTEGFFFNSEHYKSIRELELELTQVHSYFIYI